MPRKPKRTFTDKLEYAFVWLSIYGLVVYVVLRLTGHWEA